MGYLFKNIYWIICTIGFNWNTAEILLYTMTLYNDLVFTLNRFTIDTYTYIKSWLYTNILDILYLC